MVGTPDRAALGALHHQRPRPTASMCTVFCLFVVRHVSVQPLNWLQNVLEFRTIDRPRVFYRMKNL